MRKSIYIDGTISNKPIGFEFDIEYDDSGILDIKACDIVFRENINVDWKIIPVNPDLAGHLWDRLDADTQDELAREEEDPFFDEKYRRGIN